MIVPSYFGYLAEQQNLQAMIDNSLNVLQGQSIWRQYLDEGVPQASLSFETAIGRARIEAAASIVEEDAEAPLRSRPTLELYTGKIPAIKEKFRLPQKDLRTIMTLQESRNFNEDARKMMLIKTLWDDVSKASVAGDKRVDIMLLNALSTLTVDVTATNNPDGVIYGTLDLLSKPYQKQGVPVVWTDLANATPIDDIENYLLNIYKTFGRSFGKILMSYDLWLQFRRTNQVIDRLKSFFNIGKANGSYSATLENVNEMFAANMWPPIEIINYVSGIEKDGIISPIRPFNTNNVSFVPAGKLGILENAFPMERMVPIKDKSYANFGPTLVSKWMDNDPITEFTAMELLAFPSLTEIDGIFILETNVVQNGFIGTTGQ